MRVFLTDLRLFLRESGGVIILATGMVAGVLAYVFQMSWEWYIPCATLVIGGSLGFSNDPSLGDDASVNNEDSICDGGDAGD